MLYKIIDDENQLYKQMFSDFWIQDQYDIEEIPKVCIGSLMRNLFRLHFSKKLSCGGKINLPGKQLWDKYYGLNRAQFDSDKEYCVMILNGALKVHYSYSYLKKFKENHSNVKLVLIMYDTYATTPYKQRIEEMLPLFWKVFSFDKGDCDQYGFEYLYQTFSYPKFVKKDSSLYSDLFFAGMGGKELKY